MITPINVHQQNKPFGVWCPRQSGTAHLFAIGVWNFYIRSKPKRRQAGRGKLTNNKQQ